MAKVTKIDRVDAVALLEDLGFKMAGDWNNKKLARKLVDKTSDRKREELEEDLGKDGKKVLASVLGAAENDLKLVVTGDEESNGDEKSKPEKKSKDKDKKAKGDKAKKSKEPGAPSNKEVVYKMWKKAPKKFDPEDAHKSIKKAVELTTIRSWASQWKNGNNLPSCARE